MRNRTKVVALFASLLLGVSLYIAPASADQQPGPTVSKALAKPLKAANEAMQARNWDAALSNIKEAQSTAGEKSAYDQFLMNEMLGFVYSQKQDYLGAEPALEAAAQSPYATPEQKKAWLKAVMGMYFAQKDYAKTVEIGELALKQGVTDADTYTTIADSQSKLGDCKTAAATIAGHRAPG